MSAKDLDTGKEQSITITDTERMSDAEIEAAIRDAEQYAAQDQLRRDDLAVREEAQRLLADVDRALGTAGKQLDKEEKKAIKADEAALRKLLDARPARPIFGKKGKDVAQDASAAAGSDTAALRAAMERLRQSSAHARDVGRRAVGARRLMASRTLCGGKGLTRTSGGHAAHASGGEPRPATCSPQAAGRLAAFAAFR